MKKNFAFKMLAIACAGFLAVLLALSGAPVGEIAAQEIGSGASATVDENLSSSTSDLITVMVLLLPVIFLFSFFDKIMGKF